MGRAQQKGIDVASDLISALALLTRLPVAESTPRGAAAAWAWPLAGALVAGLALLPGLALSALGLGPAIVAGVVLVAQILLTGALHEDGLADTADALWGGRDRARRLEIMKDSRIGTYGALALVFSVGLRWSALAALFTMSSGAALIAAAALSRAAMTAPMATLPPARPGGLSAGTGRPGTGVVAGAAALALVIGCLAAGWSALVAALGALAVTARLIRTFRRTLGGQTGDTLGATQQLTELAVLVTLAALLG